MSEYSYPFNAELIGDIYDRQYDADDISAAIASLIGDGIARTDDLQCYSAGGMKINVAPGSAFIAGRVYRSDDTITCTLSDTVNARIDTIILRCDFTARSVNIKCKSGTPSEAPAAPDLMDNDKVKEIALADIYVAANAVSISGSQITDRRVLAKYPVDFEKLYDEYRADLEKRLNLVSDGDGKKALFNDGQYKSTGEMKELKRFTASGTFNPVNYPSKNNMYLIVIVGGGGGCLYGGTTANLGGASGDIRSLMLSLAEKNYRVTVGAGGAWSYENKGNPGGNTQFEFYTAPGGVSGAASIKDRLDYITAFGGVYPSKSAKTRGGVNMLGIGSGGNASKSADGNGKNGICIVYGFE